MLYPLMELIMLNKETYNEKNFLCRCNEQHKKQYNPDRYIRGYLSLALSQRVSGEAVQPILGYKLAMSSQTRIQQAHMKWPVKYACRKDVRTPRTREKGRRASA
eukprot:6177985-Pleurochrysis_carterae.AAC.2